MGQEGRLKKLLNKMEQLSAENICYINFFHFEILYHFRIIGHGMSTGGWTSS